MPIYEYKCDLCNGLWDEIQKFSDDPLTVCKNCEKEGGTHKLFSGKLAFHLKGGGWAGDGYSSKGRHDKIETRLEKQNDGSADIVREEYNSHTGIRKTLETKKAPRGKESLNESDHKKSVNASEK